jgi:hypothetical protein
MVMIPETVVGEGAQLNGLWQSEIATPPISVRIHIIWSFPFPVYAIDTEKKVQTEEGVLP